MATKLVTVYYLVLFLWLPKLLVFAETSVAKPGCSDSCGNVTIPYPFGIGPDCYLDREFEITCNKSSHPNNRPFITGINLELLEISLQSTTVRVKNPVLSSNCENRAPILDVSLSSSPFSFSDTHNRFTALGCDNLALIYRQSMVIGGCLSICNVTVREKSCYGINCCQTTIPPYLKFINASFRSVDPNKGIEGCRVAFMVDKDWFSSNTTDINGLMKVDSVPAVLKWSVSNGICSSSSSINGGNSTDICGDNTSCSNKLGINYECSCNEGYQGNPYISCQDINECEDPSKNTCKMLCINTPGSFKCSCPDGYVSVGNKCYSLSLSYNRYARSRVIVIGVCVGLGIIFLLIGI